MYNKKGFTLIEVLLSAAIVGTLSSITLAAINPARHFDDANDAIRKRHVKTILDAVKMYQIDNRGRLPEDLETSYAHYGNYPFESSIEKRNVPDEWGYIMYMPEYHFDLCKDLYPTYLSEIPLDPDYRPYGYDYDPQPYFNSCEDYFTGYRIQVGDWNSFDYMNPPAAQENRITIFSDVHGWGNYIEATL